MHQQEEFLTTNDLAKSFNVRGSSIRRALCIHGHYMGMVPVKWPNGRLGWRKSQMDSIISGQQVDDVGE